MKIFCFYSVLIYTSAFSPLNVLASTLNEVIEREKLVCGVRGGSAGFARISNEGNWEGLDADYCKAVAAAVLNDKEKVDYRILDTAVRFAALQNGEIDVLIRNTTWTYSRDVNMGIEFTGINFYDGQGFIAWRDGNKTSLKDYGSGTKICVEKNTSSITNIKDYMERNNRNYKLLEFISTDTAEDSFFARRCELYTTDISILTSLVSQNAINSKAYNLLDDRISKEPLGPVVRNNDAQWKNIIRWTLYATIEAEEKGINSSNVASLKKNSQDPSIRFILGSDPGVGKMIGLDDDWIYRIISSVGNYGEIFYRNMGAGSKIGMSRGLNDLWTRGGLMYSPPLR